MADKLDTHHETVLEATGVSARIARVYAEALVAAAGEDVEAVGEELDALVRDVLDGRPQIEAFFANVAVNKGAKADALKAAFGGNSSDLVRNFVGLLNQNGRLGLIRAIQAEFQKIRDARSGRVRVKVTSAVPLTGAQLAELKTTLGTSLNAQPVLEARTNPDILGGLIVQVGDRVYDSSVRTRLESLRTHLMASGSHGSA